ncbi:hypothetical protein DAETH_39530 (plasmid) [Deinococcus aetherius]|uniref:Lipoprotein n=1 Tax=Deinococcus aetherius TaxID=200252 RepID=A0ABM8AJI9_9DEIO|nr:hypothetical protein [Deinococcus aetherius]BDP43984.1 hypothetical protein DAETH_39530 [Deinococcus aetherius]
MSQGKIGVLLSVTALLSACGSQTAAPAGAHPPADAAGQFVDQQRQLSEQGFVKLSEQAFVRTRDHRISFVFEGEAGRASLTTYLEGELGRVRAQAVTPGSAGSGPGERAITQLLASLREASAAAPAPSITALKKKRPPTPPAPAVCSLDQAGVEAGGNVVGRSILGSYAGACLGPSNATSCYAASYSVQVAYVGNDLASVGDFSASYSDYGASCSGNSCGFQAGPYGPGMSANGYPRSNSAYANAYVTLQANPYVPPVTKGDSYSFWGW